MLEDVNVLHCIGLVIAGICAGFFNVFAGGGSLLTLPFLMDVVGLPAAVANGTNRFGIIALNGSAIAGFQSKGYKVTKYTITLGIIALVFSIPGAMIGIGIPDDLFKKILAGVMIFAIIATVLKPMLVNSKAIENMSKNRKILGMIAFAGVGFYGGFIQAGVGFVIITVLSLIHNMKLTKLNSIKVAVVGMYTLAALFIFIYQGKFVLFYGLILALGTIIGAFFGARLNASIDEKYVKIALIVILAMMAIKIFFFDN